VRLMPLHHRVLTSNTAIWYSVECYLPRFTSKNKTSHSHGRFRCWLHKARASPLPPPSYKKQKTDLLVGFAIGSTEPKRPNTGSASSPPLWKHKAARSYMSALRTFQQDLAARTWSHLKPVFHQRL